MSSQPLHCCRLQSARYEKEIVLIGAAARSALDRQGDRPTIRPSVTSFLFSALFCPLYLPLLSFCLPLATIFLPSSAFHLNANGVVISRFDIRSSLLNSFKIIQEGGEQGSSYIFHIFIVEELFPAER